MPNYQDGEIYYIYNTVNDDICIGRTTLNMCEIMRYHRTRHRTQAYTHLLLSEAFAEHGIDNLSIERIDKCPCNDRDELHKQRRRMDKTIETIT